MCIAGEAFKSAASAIIVGGGVPMTTTNMPDDAEVTEHPKLIRTYRTRAYLSAAGHVRLDDVLAQQCLLYNAALEERKTAWKQHRERISFAEQSRSLTAVRKDFPGIEGSLHRRIQDATLKRLDRAFAAFHRRVQAGEAPGHPRFKSSRRWKTLEMYSGNARCVFVDESTGKGFVNIKGLPKLRFKDKRVPVGIQPLQILVSRRPNGVYLYFVFDHLEAQLPVGEVKNPVGINAGRGGVRWGFSDGSTVGRRRVDDKGRRRIQRKVARQKLGSKSRQKTVAQLAKHTHREKIRNRNELHRITTQFVEKYDFFAIEDLSIMALTRSARGTLENPGQGVTIKAAANRSMLEQTWGEFAQILTYKAEGAGVSVVRVDPAYTSLTCSRCGVAQFDASEQERNRIRFRCPDCGNDLNRSVNAAKNILVRGLAEPVLSAGESVIAGRASMEEITPEMSGVRPENHVST